MELKENILRLSRACGLSGREGSAAEVARELLEPLADECWTDALGNLFGLRRCGTPGAKTILLDAHLDEIGLMVTGVEEGFLRFCAVGGVDPRMLPNRELVVLTEPPMKGIVACLPPHVQTAAEQGKSLPISQLFIDVGLSQEAAERLVPIGTPVAFASEPFVMGGQVCGKSLDDRACFAILLRALELVKEDRLKVDVCVMGSVQEELGGRGAKVGTFSVNPERCIAVDVTHAETPDAPKDKTLKLNGGVAIGIGPNMHREMSRRLVDIAREQEIPYQLEPMSGDSGTNGWVMQVAREGVATAVLSLPLKYMHSPVETASLADAESVAALIAAYLREVD